MAACNGEGFNLIGFKTRDNSRAFSQPWSFRLPQKPIRDIRIELRRGPSAHGTIGGAFDDVGVEIKRRRWLNQPA